MSPIEAVWQQTLAGFDWLAAGLDSGVPVTFVPNPGNVGDALINVSCFRYLTTRFRSVAVSPLAERPPTETVFLAGGGNLVEGLYASVAEFLAGPGAASRLYFFPSTIRGFGSLLDGVSGRARVICREPASYRHVAQHLPAEAVRLGHDAAFAVADRLHAAFGPVIAHRPAGKARFLRRDIESAIAAPGDGDLMARRGGDWTNLAEAESAVISTAQEILLYGRIYTDRLHCAILSAMLERDVVFLPNSYFKNRAVFEHSLAQFPNVRFESELV